MFRKYTLKKPANRHARIGAFYASLLPVIIGFMLLSAISQQTTSLWQSLNLPIAIALIFGTPIVAWLFQDAVKNLERIDYWKLVEIALFRATILQLIFGTICIVYLYNSTVNLFEFKSLISACLTVHTLLWIVVTMPLTLACSVIFKLSALRPLYG